MFSLMQLLFDGRTAVSKSSSSARVLWKQTIPENDASLKPQDNTLFLMPSIIIIINML